MMPFTDQIHQAFLGIVRSSALPVDRDLPERIRDLGTSAEDRDRIARAQGRSGPPSSPRQWPRTSG